MTSKHILPVILFICLVGFLFTKTKVTPIKFVVPQGWGKPVYNFKNNPLTEEGFRLGRELFYDPILSSDSTISCASCHLQSSSFTHIDHDLSHGIGGKIGTRNSMTIMNMAWSKNFMWDGAINHLDMQPIAPITSQVEMGETFDNVVNKINLSNKYKRYFKDAFGQEVATGQRILLALSQFILELNSFNSKYDSVMYKKTTFSQQEKNGYRLFQKNCNACHKEPLFTTGEFENNGLPIDTTLNDIGRMRVTGRKEDSLKFKVPTLRNIEFSYPYMHDGRFKKLSEVISHYRNGIVYSNTLSEKLKEKIILSDNEKIDLIAFLFTLSDKKFLFNKRFSYQKK